MAEFQDVMKQAKRMCTAHTCGDCPLRTMEGGCRMCFPPDEIGNQRELEAIQRIVMEWAAANPEPRYPSWHDAWKQLFPESKFTPCPVSNFGVNRPCDHNCAECKETQMTADIAEKLGIKLMGERR